MKQKRYNADYKAQAALLIRRHEGVRPHPYTDTLGKMTIGVGRNLSDRGLSPAEIEMLFENDMAIAANDLDIWCAPWRSYSAHRRAALLSMSFNLGGPRLMGFVKMRAALLACDFTTAADEALNSKWAGQIGQRATDIAAMIKDG